MDLHFRSADSLINKLRPLTLKLNIFLNLPIIHIKDPGGYNIFRFCRTKKNSKMSKNHFFFEGKCKGKSFSLFFMHFYDHIWIQDKKLMKYTSSTTYVKINEIRNTWCTSRIMDHDSERLEVLNCPFWSVVGHKIGHLGLKFVIIFLDTVRGTIYSGHIPNSQILLETKNSVLNIEYPLNKNANTAEENISKFFIVRAPPSNVEVFIKRIKKIYVQAEVISQKLQGIQRMLQYIINISLDQKLSLELKCCFSRAIVLMQLVKYIKVVILAFQKSPSECSAHYRTTKKCIRLNALYKRIIYRDLKLDNVLLDHEGHIKLTDYGMCKEGIRPGDTTSTFCGTPNYIAPEILQGVEYSFSVDWWALGVLLYEMLAGKSPFDIVGASDNPDCNTEDFLFQVILERPIRIPRSLSVKAASILKGFLNKNPIDRLGCHPETGFTDIVTHPFFKTIDWEMLEQRQVPPPYRPRLDSDRDLANFPPEFTDEPMQLTPDDQREIDNIDQSEFEGFEYVNPLLMSMEDCV
ncbi:unnamed protein product, partial [Meganyctiphanes norvegica]